MEQETKTEGIESNTGETNTKRSRRRQTQRNVLHLISTSAREAGKVSQASAATSTHTSHQHLSLSMKIEKHSPADAASPKPPVTIALHLH